VGARAATRRAVEIAHTIARDLAGRGITIVSGGALGVDAAAHRGALAAPGGRTIAVLGTGIDVPYPVRHRALYDQIVARGGAVISPFPPGTPPRPWQFPVRNRVLAALCDAVLVVEAGARSGSLSTARAARALRRLVLAVPSSPGTDALVLSGGFAIASADEVVHALHGKRRARPRPEGSLGQALDALGASDALSIEDLARKSGLSPVDAQIALARLALTGYVARLPGERYKRLEAFA
jgi:DNA processing protein